MPRDTDDWEKLSRKGRVALCRSMAETAIEQAFLARPEDKAAYEALAAKWLELADEIERISN